MSGLYAFYVFVVYFLEDTCRSASLEMPRLCEHNVTQQIERTDTQDTAETFHHRPQHDHVTLTVRAEPVGKVAMTAGGGMSNSHGHGILATHLKGKC